MADGRANRLTAWGARYYSGLIVSGLFLLFVLLFFADRIFITIPAGHGGALWLRFFGGTVLNFSYGEGTKLILPWDKIYVYDLRVQQKSDRFDILTKEGLQITTDATLRFRLNPRSLPAITAFAGPDFVSSLVLPSVGAATRLEAARYSAEEIYSTRRHEIERRIHQRLSSVIDELIPGHAPGDSEIFIQDFWFRSIILPQYLASSIEAKLTQQQLAEQYVYILQREARERERKTIEAEGIKSFQDIVSKGISDNYLRWKGIDATLKLAESPNSKIVIVGGKDGMPLILGPLDSTPITAPAPGPGQAAKAGAANVPSPSEPSLLQPGTSSYEPLTFNPDTGGRGAVTNPSAPTPGPVVQTPPKAPGTSPSAQPPRK